MKLNRDILYLLAEILAMGLAIGLFLVIGCMLSGCWRSINPLEVFNTCT